MLNPKNFDREEIAKYREEIAKRLGVLVLVFQLLASVTGTAKNITDIFQATRHEGVSLPVPHREVGK